MMQDLSFSSVPDVANVEAYSGPASDRDPIEVLFEVPHGATAARCYHAVRDRLDPELPADLQDFFFVNTDVGSTEYARAVARLVVDPDATVRELIAEEARARVADLPPRRAHVIQCLIPRTFIDTNRIVDPAAPDGMTAALADYIRRPEDVAVLTRLHQQYHGLVERAYRTICSGGGWAVMPHTYAPKSVDIQTIDEGIGRALRQAYEPEVYETWAWRPQVDIISESREQEMLAPASLVHLLEAKLAAVGIESAQNSTYRLHPATMGHRYSALYPGRVLCMEVRRDLLADPFDPFVEMKIGSEKVTRVARPIAAAFLESLTKS
ncbi:MAG: hypothetical protein R3E12_18870 [Candidatus Eisenbacteria bacterium]|uniref:Uncharacterized protein n=1 Tax=Eiseniibacteriota bacterium TaxID=2212470 RepID=A0A956LVB8_UNCEI|nr:hypothetical protein [Candidatus Eisenbacteria bacterium]